MKLNLIAFAYELQAGDETDGGTVESVETWADVAWIDYKDGRVLDVPFKQVLAIVRNVPAELFDPMIG